MRMVEVRMKPYIQPFERNLALKELRALAGENISGPSPADENVYLVNTRQSVSRLQESLSYWETVASASKVLFSQQTLREATVNLARNGVPLESLRRNLPFMGEPPVPNRRCLRYGTHGIHEYRGKFFPQLVKSLINISGIRRGAIVADPMCGSGTTIVEAALAGMGAKGLDMNPLSVYVSDVKSRLLNAQPGRIESGYERVRELLLQPRRGRGARKLLYFESLPESDRNYLTSWFSEEVLVSLDEIVQAIETVSYRLAKDLMRVSLSNILRRVSWQKNDDLRVRREIRLDVEVDPKREFLEELGRSVRIITAFLRQNGRTELRVSVQEGDARNCGRLWDAEAIDAVITSPPYATALPYLDTDRLSLCYLQLLGRREHRRRDFEMIGNREVSEGQRMAFWEGFQQNGAELPGPIRELISEIENLNSRSKVGFRRKNLPSLLAKYFFDMTEVLSGVSYSLKPGGFAFMVVGSNHTMAGGKRVDINTPKLLQHVATSVGFEPLESLSMEMLTSRDIFKRNAGQSEEILFLRKC